MGREYQQLGGFYGRRCFKHSFSRILAHANPSEHLQVRWDVHDVHQILEEYHFIGLADWEESKGQIRDFLEVMRVNDIVAIKHGQQLVALAQVIGGAYNIHKDRALCVSEEEDPLVDWIHYRRPVKILDWAKERGRRSHRVEAL